MNLWSCITLPSVHTRTEMLGSGNSPGETARGRAPLRVAWQERANKDEARIALPPPPPPPPRARVRVGRPPFRSSFPEPDETETMLIPIPDSAQ